MHKCVGVPNNCQKLPSLPEEHHVAITPYSLFDRNPYVPHQTSESVTRTYKFCRSAGLLLPVYRG